MFYFILNVCSTFLHFSFFLYSRSRIRISPFARIIIVLFITFTLLEQCILTLPVIKPQISSKIVHLTILPRVARFLSFQSFYIFVLDILLKSGENGRSNGGKTVWKKQEWEIPEEDDKGWGDRGWWATEGKRSRYRCVPLNVLHGGESSRIHGAGSNPV